MASKNLVLRTIYIDPAVDDQLRDEAFAGRTSKNDLFRRYLNLGMEAARATQDTAGKKSPVKAKPAAATK